MTMDAIRSPLILYIPGLLPKPQPDFHKDALYKCLLKGVQQVNPQVADEIAASEHSFDVVSWTYDFYREHRDIALDRQAIDAVCETPVANEADRAEAASWKRRASRWIYRLGDLMPFLIPHLASEKTEVHLRDLRRYLRNQNQIADHIREMLKVPLRAATESGRPILLIAHSMGSVISYESLWQMTHEHSDRVVVDLLLTMGSPLGQNFLQKRILGHDRVGALRYPDNIRRWINLAAIGDLTAVDPMLKNDFEEMVELGLMASIEDRRLFNAFRLDGQLNTHAEYGYMANEVTGRAIVDWWPGKR